MSGKWWLGTRGSGPKPWDPWQWTELERYGLSGSPALGVLAMLLRWADMGQHVRLEFVPDSVIDPEDKN